MTYIGGCYESRIGLVYSIIIVVYNSDLNKKRLFSLEW